MSERGSILRDQHKLSILVDDSPYQLSSGKCRFSKIRFWIDIKFETVLSGIVNSVKGLAELGTGALKVQANFYQNRIALMHRDLVVKRFRTVWWETTTLRG